MDAKIDGNTVSPAQDLRLAAIWGLLAGLAAAAVIPYMAETVPGVFAKIRWPLGWVALLQGIQSAFAIGVLAWFGLRMGHRVGLGSPLLRAWVNTRKTPDWQVLKPLQSAAVGALAGMAVIGTSLLLDLWMPEPVHSPAFSNNSIHSALWGLLASFYGGIAEELQFRLFLMTLIVWLVVKLHKSQPAPSLYWAAIVIAALLFGAGHLPAAAKIGPLDSFVTFRILALNAVVAIAFGWLYWKRGVEMAMLGHFSADIVLHVLAPLMLSAAGFA